MEIRTADQIRISDNAPLKVTIAGSVIDVMQQERPTRPPEIIWSDDRKTYTIVATGEVRTAKKRKTRTDDKTAIDEMRKSMRRMRQLINANWSGDRNELMITLTYAECMTDAKRLKKDMEKWIKKAKRRLGEIKYLYVVEPQARGAWHAHCLLKQLSAHSTYWPAEDVADCWGHGYVKVKRLDSCDNVGAYLSAYLTNLPTAAEDDELTANVDAALGDDVPSKAAIKGERLHLYPKGMHYYRASKNLDQPITKKMRPTSAEYQALIAGADQRFARTIELYDDATADKDAVYVNSITQLQYVRNSRRMQGGDDND